MATKTQNLPGDVTVYDPGDYQGPGPNSLLDNMLVGVIRVGATGVVRSSRGFTELSGTNVRTGPGTYTVHPREWSDLASQIPLTYLIGQTIGGNDQTAVIFLQSAAPGVINVITTIAAIESNLEWCLLALQGPGPGV